MYRILNPHTPICLCSITISLYVVPRPSPAPVFDHLLYAKTEPEGLVDLTTWFAAWLTSQILDMETYSHLYLQLQRSWRNKTNSSQETSPTSWTLPTLKQNRLRMVPLQALQIQKQLLCATLAKFCHCGHFTRVVRQPFVAMPSSSNMFCTLDVVLFQRSSRLCS